MNRKYLYIGCFFPKEELEKSLGALPRKALEKEIRTPHVTLAYKPEAVDRSLFGTPVSVRAVGYGCDGVNEGLLVELSTGCEALQALADGVETPHITLSLAENGEAVNTRFLAFSPIEPFTLTAVFGGFRYSGTVDIRKRDGIL